MATALTGATCGEACWRAQEEICRCSCGGRNHGCDRTGDRPYRTCRVKYHTYRMIAVLPDGYRAGENIGGQGGGWYQARIQASELTRSLPEHMYGFEPVFERRASESAMKWPELEAYRADTERPYLIWAREDAAEALNAI